MVRRPVPWKDNPDPTNGAKETAMKVETPHLPWCFFYKFGFRNFFSMK